MISTGPAMLQGQMITIMEEPSVQTLECDLFIRNNTDRTILVRARKIELEVLSGSSNYFCWGDFCLPPTAYESTGNIALQAGQVTDSLDFYGHFQPSGKMGSLRIKYVFFDESNPDDSAFVVVHYFSGHAGSDDGALETGNISYPFPNPASQATTFDLHFTSPTLLLDFTLIDLQGKRVLGKNAIPGQGKFYLDVSFLAEGIYLYRFSHKGRSVHSGKLLVDF